jgi:hypothetical protein
LKSSKGMANIGMVLAEDKNLQAKQHTEIPNKTK